jgi:hypothetical protein
MPVPPLKGVLAFLLRFEFSCWPSLPRAPSLNPPHPAITAAALLSTFDPGLEFHIVIKDEGIPSFPGIHIDVRFQP